MSVACPSGHQSETADFCDQCGAKIEGLAAAAEGTPPPVDPATALPDTAGATGAATTAAGPAVEPASLCPVCGVPRVGDGRFCEGCGRDFTAPAPDGGRSTDGWQAEVTADREYYERLAPDGVPFPAHCPPRRFALSEPEIRVGRHSTSRGIQPEIDLAGPPEDSAISHLHCLLLAQPDGSYSLVDPGSTNRTTLNDDPTPLSVNVPVGLADGDRIHLGAWTTITLRRLPGSPS